MAAMLLVISNLLVTARYRKAILYKQSILTLVGKALFNFRSYKTHVPDLPWVVNSEIM